MILFFKRSILFLKIYQGKYIIPHIGKLNESDISDKPDNSKVTKYDLIVEEELITFFKSKRFQNIISEEHSQIY
jgi:fructose-1,6-bisphosphatase/inositol monophosphatase family enzyme